MVKRDDLFEVAGVCGGKARACLGLVRRAPKPRLGLVTAGAAASPQVNIVAHIGAELGLPVRAHVPKTKVLSPEIAAAKARGAEIIQHAPGYNTVIVARCRADARARGWIEIPFGMECPEAVIQTWQQAALLPWGQFKRIVMPCGSGMSLAGVLWALKESGCRTPVIAVRVGADPSKRLDEYAPDEWRAMVQIVDSGTGYKMAAETQWNGITLDPHYEAKAARFVQPDDLFWIVGLRQTVKRSLTTE
jgi:1-aminocyclopropane-1-carboxylate deaminase/D-cysteine desulfhydrase-like pyridoxal-dependent ACC family enzyme